MDDESHNPYRPPVDSPGVSEPRIPIGDLLFAPALPLARLLGAVWRVYWGNIGKLAGVALIVYMPINTLLAFATARGLIEDTTRWQRVAEFFVGVVATLAIACIVEGAARDAPVSLGRALARAVLGWFQAIGTELLATLVVLAFSLLLIVPGVIHSGYYLFTLQLVALRSEGGSVALESSKKLVKGAWWPLVGTWVLVWLVMTVLLFVLWIPYGWLIDLLAVRDAPDALLWTMVVTGQSAQDLLFFLANVTVSALFLHREHAVRLAPPAPEHPEETPGEALVEDAGQPPGGSH
jgi:hypothetical protein